MKLTILVTAVTSFFLNNDIIAQKNVNTFEYSIETAHPNAKKLMAEDFYWSPIEETGPFGSDAGSDAAYGFKQWRSENKSTSPITYLKELIASWNLQTINWDELDTLKIKKYLTSQENLTEEKVQQKTREFKEMLKNSGDTSMNNIDDQKLQEMVKATSKQMNGDYLLEQDNAIIGTGFAQFVLEGKIDENLQILTTTAIKRELLPLLINRYEKKYQATRKEQLTKMLHIVKKMNS
jgi:uncharacterized protein YfeS